MIRRHRDLPLWLHRKCESKRHLEAAQGRGDRFPGLHQLDVMHRGEAGAQYLNSVDRTSQLRGSRLFRNSVPGALWAVPPGQTRRYIKLNLIGIGKLNPQAIATYNNGESTAIKACMRIRRLIYPSWIGVIATGLPPGSITQCSSRNAANGRAGW